MEMSSLVTVELIGSGGTIDRIGTFSLAAVEALLPFLLQRTISYRCALDLTRCFTIEMGDQEDR